MRIAFLLGSPSISGGTNVIFEHATRLQRCGNDVTIITEEKVDQASYSWHPDAGTLTWETLSGISEYSFDFTIATWWQSVQLLAEIRSKYYVYFVQSIESRFFPPRDSRIFSCRDIDILAEWCESTYRYPLPVITEARWIQDYLFEKYNHSSRLVRNGIRKDIYNEQGVAVEERIPGRLRVLVEGPLGVFYKNVERTIELCAEAGVSEIWLLTSSDITDYPGVDRVFSRVPIAQTAGIYRSCDVLVKLSHVEGMFGPPLEMFHCGGTSIVYAVSGHDEYIQDTLNSMVVEKDDEKGVLSCLTRLQREPDLLERLKEGARKTARNWPDWDECAGEFSKCLEEIEHTSPPHGGNFLKEYNTNSFLFRERSYIDRSMSRFAEREQAVIAGKSEFTNYIQVYWDEGQGLTTELVEEYSTGIWDECKVIIPVKKYPVTVRIDPSVRVGIIMVRKIRLADAVTGNLLVEYSAETGWDEIYMSGTMVCLDKSEDLFLEAYGEDPQLILPSITNRFDSNEICLSICLCEMSFAEALNRGRQGTLYTQKKSIKKRMANILSFASRGNSAL